MIEGSFRDVSLPALLQLLCLEANKSFRIRVTDKNQRGYILIRKGWIIAAKFGILEGEDAICEFLSWDEGTFLAEQVVAQTDVEKNLGFDFQCHASFIQNCAILAEQNIGLNSEIKGSQFFGSEEWKTLVKDYPLDRDCYSVLAWLREGRKMRQALREFGFDVVRATAILAMLIKTRSVQVIRPGAAVSGKHDHKKQYEYKLVPTTGGQQEAAAALAKEAAKALEPASDVAGEAFMSRSFKTHLRQPNEEQGPGKDTPGSRTQNHSVDLTQMRSSMEARLRAKKNSGTLSDADFPAYTENAQAKLTDSKQTPDPISSGQGKEPGEPKRQRLDLFTVLRNQPDRVVPDLGAVRTSANSGQATASTHDLPTIKQADLRQGQPLSGQSTKSEKTPPAAPVNPMGRNKENDPPEALENGKTTPNQAASLPVPSTQVPIASSASSGTSDVIGTTESASKQPGQETVAREPSPEPPLPEQAKPTSSPEHSGSNVLSSNDPRLIAKTQAMPLVAFDIERLLQTTFIATQFGKLALGNPALDPHRRQTLLDTEYGKPLATAIQDRSGLPAAVLSSYRYCLDRGYIETRDPVIPLTADLLLGRMEIDQYLLQRRRITGDELRDLIKIAREKGIKLTQLLVKSGYLTEPDLEALAREQKRFAFK